MSTWIAGVLAFQRSFLFPRHAIGRAPSVASIAGLERWSIATDEGPVPALFVPGDGATAEQPAPAVVFAHGNAELAEHFVALLSPYRRMGISVLLPEYRGYGRAAGSPSQEKITDDLLRFVAQLEARPEVDGSRIVYHGRSLGGGAVCAVSRRRAPRAIVLQSTFTSVTAAARRFLVPSFLVLDPFDNEACLREVRVPVLIAHGRRDRLVPFHHAETLQRTARRCRLVAYEADHNDCPPSWDAWLEEVRLFLLDASVLAEQSAVGSRP